MKTALIALILTLTFSLEAHAEPLATSLPAAPSQVNAKPPRVFTAADWSLSAALVASHLADMTSTESCISHPTCKEVILPSALVHSRPAFAAYELGTASLEVFAAYELSKHHHRNLARLAQFVNVGLTFKTDVNNYQRAAAQKE